MKQVEKKARANHGEVVFDLPTKIQIPGTKKIVSLRGVKPYTIERLTLLWLEREDAVRPQSSSDTMKDLCIEPYFAVKEALLYVLNNYWKIKFFFPFLSWWWGKVKGYTEEQMAPIILEGKKKLPLAAHWMNMAYSLDMRNDWMTMTKAEAEQYRAELLSAEKQLSSKNSLATETPEGSSSAS